MHPILIGTPHHTRYIYMYTPGFHSYHTAVMLLSDLDFVALNNEHIFMGWHQTRVKRVGAMDVSCKYSVVSPAQKYIWAGLWVGQ